LALGGIVNRNSELFTVDSDATDTFIGEK